MKTLEPDFLSLISLHEEVVSKGAQDVTVGPAYASASRRMSPCAPPENHHVLCQMPPGAPSPPLDTTRCCPPDAPRCPQMPLEKNRHG